MESGSRTQVSMHPGPLTFLAGFSTVRKSSTHYSIRSDGPNLQISAVPLPSASSLSFPTPSSCILGRQCVPRIKELRTVTSHSGENGSFPPQGRLRGCVLALWRGCTHIEASEDSLAERGTIWQFSASCGLLRTMIS